MNGAGIFWFLFDAKGLVGHTVAIRPGRDGGDMFDVYFCHQRLRTIDVNKPDYGP
jgi:hypothetical protein